MTDGSDAVMQSVMQSCSHADLHTEQLSSATLIPVLQNAIFLRAPQIEAAYRLAGQWLLYNCMTAQSLMRPDPGSCLRRAAAA